MLHCSNPARAAARRLRVLARAARLSRRASCAATCREMRDAAARRARAAAGAPGRARSADRLARARRSARRRGRLRASFSTAAARTSLHLFEHVHGDSRDRGPAMIDLAQTYEKAGLYLAPGELPDYLPVVLEFVSTQPPREARAFLGEMAHILNAIFSALQQRGSALRQRARRAAGAGRREGAAGEAGARGAARRELGRAAGFDGCSTKGQAQPGQPQPIRIVRKDRRRRKERRHERAARLSCSRSIPTSASRCSWWAA